MGGAAKRRRQRQRQRTQASSATSSVPATTRAASTAIALARGNVETPPAATVQELRCRSNGSTDHCSNNGGTSNAGGGSETETDAEKTESEADFSGRQGDAESSRSGKGSERREVGGIKPGVIGEKGGEREAAATNNNRKGRARGNGVRSEKEAVAGIPGGVKRPLGAAAMSTRGRGGRPNDSEAGKADAKEGGENIRMPSNSAGMSEVAKADAAGAGAGADTGAVARRSARLGKAPARRTKKVRQIVVSVPRTRYPRRHFRATTGV